ncbi:MAG: DUF3108 domain-containing protein [Pseudomonadota bacterium]
MRSNLVRRLALAAMVCASATPVAFAQTINHETRFSVRFGGVEIGRAIFDISFDEKTYELNGSGNTTGLVEWLAPATGSFTSRGLLDANRPLPQIHKVSLKESKKAEESVQLSFSGNAVSDVKIVSAKKRVRAAPKYVPVEASHMAAVMDPVSALIVPVSDTDAGNGVKVCNQRFPVFDGETRYDIQLSYKTTSPVKTAGYNGYAYVCQMRYIPVAGHKKDHRSVREMAANKNMDIWLAPMAGLSVFTPIQIRVGTKYGRFVAQPDYFGPKVN